MFRHRLTRVSSGRENAPVIATLGVMDTVSCFLWLGEQTLGELPHAPWYTLIFEDRRSDKVGCTKGLGDF
jgi:hypothetical protein